MGVMDLGGLYRFHSSGRDDITDRAKVLGFAVMFMHLQRFLDFIT